MFTYRKILVALAAVIGAEVACLGWMAAARATDDVAVSKGSPSAQRSVSSVDSGAGPARPAANKTGPQASFRILRSLSVDALSFALGRERDVLIAEWREQLASQRSTEAVDEFVKGLTSTGMKANLVVDWAGGLSNADRVRALLRQTVIDDVQTGGVMRADSETFRANVRHRCGILLASGGVPASQIEALFSSIDQQPLRLSRAALNRLVVDAEEAAQKDGARFVANYVVADVLSSALVDLGQQFGWVSPNAGLVERNALRLGSDFLIGDALDQATDFSDSIRRIVHQRLLELENAWCAALAAQIDAMLDQHRRACIVALELD